MALLLVTNDDGVHAAGLAALASAFADRGEVHVLAPEREQSACPWRAPRSACFA